MAVISPEIVPSVLSSLAPVSAAQPLPLIITQVWCFGCSALTKDFKRSFISGKQEQDFTGLQLCGFGFSISLSC